MSHTTSIPKLTAKAVLSDLTDRTVDPDKTPCQSHPRRKFQLPSCNVPSQSELMLRAKFFALAVADDCKANVSDLIGADSPEMKEHDKVAGTIKTMALASLFLTGLESGGINNSTTTLQFFAGAMAFAESLNPEPSAREILLALSDLPEDAGEDAVGQRIAEVVAVGESKERFARAASSLLRRSTTYREELSSFSLTQSEEVIGQHLQLFA